jgi:glycosyltransferase involved in cell wall biosynthesis
LNSIFNQKTNLNIEVIVVDDGSTDKTVKLLEEYLINGKIKRLLIENDGAPGKARNIGLKIAKGNYVMFLDGDDFIISDSLKRIEEYLRLNEYEFIYIKSAYSAEDSNDQINQKNNVKLRQQIFEARKIRHRKYYQNAIHIYKMETIITNKLFFPEKVQSEDTAFAFSYLCKINVVAETNILLRGITIRNDEKNLSLTQTFNEESLKSCITSFETIIPALDSRKEYLIVYSVSGLIKRLILTKNYVEIDLAEKYLVKYMDDIKFNTLKVKTPLFFILKLFSIYIIKAKIFRYLLKIKQYFHTQNL